jgi:hypothetical protein
MHREYAIGIPNPKLIAPEGCTPDAALVARAGNVDIQLDLFLDYANNVKLYHVFHEYFRKWKPPPLAIWGKHDLYFIPQAPKRSDATILTRRSNSWILDISRSKRTLRKSPSRCGLSREIATRRVEAQRGPSRYRRRPLHF